MASPSSVQSSMYFLKRDPLYDSEKVYEIRRKDPKTTVPKTNADMEQIEGISIKTCPEDFLERSKIINEYLPQLSRAVKAHLGADRVQIYDFIRRKRHPDFPVRHGNIEGVSQPASSVHIDDTQADAIRVINKINPAESPALLGRRWQLLIAWHPLRGPVQDWPLAVCDTRTVDAKKDLQPCDLIHTNHISEEYKVHYAPEQKWYYMRDQMPNEVFLLRQADSDGSTGVPHCAFPNPESLPTDPLRESFDVRLLVFYDD